MTEIFDVVDENDKTIGKASREECHKKGLLHRIAHILVLNSKGDLLVQKRTQTMDTYPGLWSSSASGHVKSGDDYSETAKRELEEELGIKSEVKEIGSVKSLDSSHMQMIKIFVAKNNGPFKLEKKEIEKAEFVNVKNLKEEIKSREKKTTPAFRIVFEKFCEAKEGTK